MKSNRIPMIILFLIAGIGMWTDSITNWDSMIFCMLFLIGMEICNLAQGGMFSIKLNMNATKKEDTDNEEINPGENK